jgi:hypothetical protein
MLLPCRAQALFSLVLYSVYVRAIAVICFLAPLWNFVFVSRLRVSVC